MVGPARLCPNAEGATKSDIPSCSFPSSISERHVLAEDLSPCLVLSLLGNRRDTTCTVILLRHCPVRRPVSDSHLISARTVVQAMYHCNLSPTSWLLWLNTKRTWEICTPDWSAALHIPYLCGMTIASIRAGLDLRIGRSGGMFPDLATRLSCSRIAALDV